MRCRNDVYKTKDGGKRWMQLLNPFLERSQAKTHREKKWTILHNLLSPPSSPGVWVGFVSETQRQEVQYGTPNKK